MTTTADSLRLLADWYEEHPETEFRPEINIGGFSTPESGAALRIARALGSFTKEYSGSLLVLSKKFGSISLKFLFYRDQVCTPRIVKNETVKVMKPDPSMPAPHMIEVEEVRNVIEWDCPSLLESEAA